MSVLAIMLGDAEIEQVLGAWRVSGSGTVYGLIIFGAIGLVTLLIVVWAIFLRKPRRRPSHHHSRHRSSEKVVSPEIPDRADVSSPPQAHHKRKRRRRKHRSRNPTLAETGGLPPIRPEIPPEIQH